MTINQKIDELKRRNNAFHDNDIELFISTLEGIIETKKIIQSQIPDDIHSKADMYGCIAYKECLQIINENLTEGFDDEQL